MKTRGPVRLLTRHFFRRFLDNDLLSPAEDLHETVATLLAGLAVGFATLALFFIVKYNPREAQPLAEKLALALNDKTLLLGGAMIVTALAAALQWNGLSLDARDLAAFGPLPLRPATLLTAKTLSLTGFVGACAVAVNALPAILFPVTVLAKAPVGLGYGVLWMVGHAVAGVAGSVFVFLALIALRNLILLALPGRAALRVLAAVQFVMVPALLTLLCVLPLLVTRVRPAIAMSRPGLGAWPPLWFLGIEEVLIGRREPVFLELARTGAIALGLSALLAVVASVAAFSRGGRSVAVLRATRPSARRLPMLDRAAGWLLRDELARASYFFTTRTLTRSPFHRVCVAAWLGLGLAVACGSIALAYGEIPIGRSLLGKSAMVLAAQANLLFFLLVGVRAAAAFPADLHAAWIFRFLAAPALQRHLAGTRCAIVVLFVLPLLLVLAPIHVVLWGLYPAVVHLACGLIWALLFIELLFHTFDRVPFVASHVPAHGNFTLRLPAYVGAYMMVVHLSWPIERLLFDNPALFVAWGGALVALVARLRGPRWRAQRDTLPVFDEQPDAAGDMGLGDAFGLGHTDGQPGVSRSGPLEVRRPAREGYDGSPVSLRSAREASGWLSRVGMDDSAFDDAPTEAASSRPSPRMVLEQVWRDVRFGVRRLRGAPAFTGFAVVTLALGIGATTAIYSVVHAVVTPVRAGDVEHQVNVYHAEPSHGAMPYLICLSYPDFRDLRATQTVFSEMAAWTGFRQILVGAGTGEFAWGEAVTGNYFHMFGVGPLIGRMIQPADDEPNATPVVVLGTAIWRARFGAEPSIVGRVVSMNGRSYEVVGVAAASFRGLFMPKLRATDVWVPLHAAGSLLSGGPDGLEDREVRQLMVRGRLEPGVSPSQAGSEMLAIGIGLDKTSPIGVGQPWQAYYYGSPEVRRHWSVAPASKVRIHESVDRYVEPVASVTMLAVELVLLVACTNLANLLLARGASRRQELAVRLALGASRWQVVREQLVEAGVITAAGSVAGLGVARALMTYVFSTTVRLGAGVNVELAPQLDLAVIGMAAFSAGIALLVFGLLPALQTSRMTIQEALSTASANAVSPRSAGRRSLVAWQVAVSVALVAVASLCVHQIVVEASQQSGLDLDRVAALKYDFQLQAMSESQGRETVDRVLDAVRRAPGVQVAAASSSLIADGASFASHGMVTMPDRPGVGRSVRLVSATPGFFAALGLRLLRGRAFDDRDTAGAAGAIVLTEKAAKRLFGTADAVGRPVTIEGVQRTDETQRADRTTTVVGILADLGTITGLREDGGVALVPFAQQYEPMITVIARTSGDPAPFVMRLRNLVATVAPELGAVDGGTGLMVAGVTSYALRVIAGVAGLLGALALGLAMVGIYGVLSYVVAGRTKEMGIRMALGATRSRIMRLVMGDALLPVVEGLVMGFTLAALAGMALRPAFLRLMPAIDPILYVVVPVPFLLATLVACYLPARRAASVDPNVAVREL